MSKIVEFNKTGGADVLEIRDVQVPDPSIHRSDRVATFCRSGHGRRDAWTAAFGSPEREGAA